ncbi:DUF2207 domain-containing protein [Tessaracoccus sp. ZS01]|uniref:DUF2207 domain-containing protein n=1 Tax=Tessaracoccus sp. ZS01 TaxID=1906324 RepID=UPI00096E19F2|nr:DUF2207 domain-containing protein [Tessaracoccus sp. ZS01]MCG6567027.1 DUF2207 domain-containing protein [Tessaracoccus sp. ZS01]OMG57436.1 hypothetical protein BJN44_05220 [Tessaracoccus sp. ZS01]
MLKLRAAFTALLLVLFTAWAVVPAAADDSAPITRYYVDVNLTEDGIAQVEVDFTMDFAAFNGRGPYFLFPTQQEGDGKRYIFEYDNISVASPTGARTDVQRESSSDGFRLRIGNANVVNTTPQDYVVSYDVKGLIASDHPESGLDEFNWDVIGPAWESRFSDVRVTVTGPAGVEKTACFYGPYDNQTPCETSYSGNSATFAVPAVNPKTPVQVVAGFPAGTFGGATQTIEEIVSPFELTPATGAVTGAGLIAAIAGLLIVRRRHTRDEVFLGLTPGLTPTAGEQGRVGTKAGKTPVAVQFHPPKGATPGEIGTLIDATADNVDVSATIIDLAVRGFLQIESDGRKDFTLYATNPPAGEALLPYERKLLGDIFKGQAVRRSRELSKAKFQNVLPDARQGLYNAVVQKGWFKSNPQVAQMVPIGMGVLLLLGAVGIGFVFGAFGWGLLAIPVALFGIGLILLSGGFRKRTATGSAYLAQAKGFELYLRTAEKETLRFEEGEDIFSKYLPYAIVFGVADRWSKLFAQLGAEGIYQADTSWYIGADLMHGYYFASAMNNLTSSFNSVMNEARMDGMSQATGGSSGFSGFSGGGGFGGGGGGSW